MDLGRGIAGRPAQRRSIQVENNGDQPLTLSNLIVPAPFTLVDGLAPTLLPGASDTFTIELPTTVPGSFSGTVRFASNDPDESTVTFTVKGDVTPPLPLTELDSPDSKAGGSFGSSVACVPVSTVTGCPTCGGRSPRPTYAGRAYL